VDAPQPLGHTIAVRFDKPTTDRLRRIAEASFRTPAALLRDWALERLASLAVDEPVEAGPVSPVTPPGDATLDRREELRVKYKPDDVVVLVVGESAPAGVTFFYQADSNLFFATREAFERAQGPLPEGTGFLEHFKELGFWLWDMAPEPVNHKRGRPRRYAVAQGVTRLKLLIEEFDPDFVVAVKTSLEGPVRQAAQLAGFPARRVKILPFPLYQWREEYVREMARFMGAKPVVDVDAKRLPEAERLKLHDAMAIVLRERGGGPLPARELANEIAERGLYERQDGGRADYSQLLLRAKNYPHLFSVDRAGVKLARRSE
jgi:hypothetical protein